MKTTLSRKISIALLICSAVFIAISFIMFFAEKAFGINTQVNTTYASLITLAFGGAWKHSSFEWIDNYGGNAAFAIAFVLLCIALILSVIMIYGYLSKKFLPKTLLNLAVIIVVLMLFTSITVCFTRQTAAGIMAQEHEAKKDYYLNLTKMTGSTIAVIVFGFLSVISYIAFALIPYLKTKFTKK